MLYIAKTTLAKASDMELYDLTAFPFDPFEMKERSYNLYRSIDKAHDQLLSFWMNNRDDLPKDISWQLEEILDKLKGVGKEASAFSSRHLHNTHWAKQAKVSKSA